MVTDVFAVARVVVVELVALLGVAAVLFSVALESSEEAVVAGAVVASLPVAVGVELAVVGAVVESEELPVDVAEEELVVDILETVDGLLSSAYTCINGRQANKKAIRTTDSLRIEKYEKALVRP